VGAAAVIIRSLLLAGYGVRGTAASSAESARVVPTPAIDELASQASSEVAVFAGGCVWGVQGVFQHVSGVTNTVSGYAGGESKSARYEIVGSGSTGHAESVQITYDPHKITYGQLLRIFFSVAHDPTQLDRQGPDFGAQYRSAIFPVDAEQARVAKCLY
jgi:peptide-methionine (S)-S-oxide reductase